MEAGSTPNFEKRGEEAGEESDATDDSDFEEDDNEKKVDRRWTFQEKKRAVDFYNASAGRTFKSVKRQWSSLNDSQFSRFKKQVANGGTK